MKISTSLLLLLVATNSVIAQAEEPKKDGLWRGVGGAAFSYASGNTNSTSLNLTVDADRLTVDDKLALYAKVLASSADNTVNGVTSRETTASQWLAGSRYDHTLSGEVFGFGGLDFSHDQINLLSLRSVVSSGLGYHLIKTSENQWDILGGLAYRTDQYIEPGILIDNELKTRHNSIDLILGEESSHQLTESTSLKQKFSISPSLSSTGYLATFDAGLSVALNKAMSLSVTLQDRYDNTAVAPVKKNDVMFFTGINVKFGG
jgi:putative salt-induced outer membrane protein